MLCFLLLIFSCCSYQAKNTIEHISQISPFHLTEEVVSFYARHGGMCACCEVRANSWNTCFCDITILFVFAFLVAI